MNHTNDTLKKSLNNLAGMTLLPRRTAKVTDLWERLVRYSIVVECLGEHIVAPPGERERER